MSESRPGTKNTLPLRRAGVAAALAAAVALTGSACKTKVGGNTGGGEAAPAATATSAAPKRTDCFTGIDFALPDGFDYGHVSGYGNRLIAATRQAVEGKGFPSDQFKMVNVCAGTEAGPFITAMQKAMGKPGKVDKTNAPACGVLWSNMEAVKTSGVLDGDTIKDETKKYKAGKETVCGSIVERALQGGKQLHPVDLKFPMMTDGDHLPFKTSAFDGENSSPNFVPVAYGDLLPDNVRQFRPEELGDIASRATVGAVAAAA